MPTCQANIIMPVGSEPRTVTLEVDFSVSPPDPDVGIMGCGIEEFTAKVIDVDVEGVTPELLAMVQALFDANEDEYRDHVDEECLAYLESMDDCREP